MSVFLRAYSVYWYVSSKYGPTKQERDLVNVFWNFKNGRTDVTPSCASTIHQVAADALQCPAFQNSPVVVPIPRSGNSKPSRDPNGDPYPVRTLCGELARNGAASSSEELLTRAHPLPSSSSSSTRSTMGEQIGSLKAEFQWELVDSPIVLVDDSITQGTQFAAAATVLRNAGYEGGICGFFVTQTVPPSLDPSTRQMYLSHQVKWNPAWLNTQPTRDDLDPWK